jgi:hypothetical protein
MTSAGRVLANAETLEQMQREWANDWNGISLRAFGSSKLPTSAP